MTTAELERYSQADFISIAESEDIVDRSELTVVAAINLDGAGVFETEATGPRPFSLPVSHIYVLETEGWETGIYAEPGKVPVLILNTETTVLSYEFWARTHHSQDADIYVWSVNAYGDTAEELGLIDDWYRHDTVGDNYPPFDGSTLGPGDTV